MRGLFIALMVAALGFVGGCDDGRDGLLCDSDESCDDGDICLAQVDNCDGNDCWGTCERECSQPSDCEGGEICTWVRTVRVCRASDYQAP